MKENDGLEACPFCGGACRFDLRSNEAGDHGYYTTVYIRCEGCGFKTTDADVPDGYAKLAKRWNTRASRPVEAALKSPPECMEGLDEALKYAQKHLASAEKNVAAMSHHKQVDMPFGLNSWRRESAIWKPIVAALKSQVPQDIEGLHSKIDMDIEDEIGREISLEESKLIGIAIKHSRRYAALPHCPDGYICVPRAD